MENTMFRNSEDLDAYYAGLRDHLFAISVAEKQKIFQRKDSAFVEEDVWMQYTGATLLCALKPVASLSSASVQIFASLSAQPSCKDSLSE